MKSWSALVLGVVVALLATTTLAAPDFASMQVIPYEPPKPAPGFSLPDLHGKVAMLFCWATW